MSNLDWLVLGGSLLFIIVYGVWKSRGSRNVSDFLLGNNQAAWWTIGLSVMATQASAITFLSTPGQAFSDGLGFIQFYFGLPLAVIVICVSFIPIFYKLKVFTAYEYLSHRFDMRTRVFTAVLFLLQRGLAAGITIYAPAIILSTILGWELKWLVVIIGVLVIVYTVSGGTRAVQQTQKLQMAVMMGGMLLALGYILYKLPINLPQSLAVAGKMGKLNGLNFNFDLQDRYNFWSGITGGFFLALSYFGTDQSQVARYLGGRSVSESRMGLIFNALLKLPMQFVILFTGVMVFVFYQFEAPPVFFNPVVQQQVMESTQAEEFKYAQDNYLVMFKEKKQHLGNYLEALRRDDAKGQEIYAFAMHAANQRMDTLKKDAKQIIAQALPQAELNDKDYVFISFILKYFPHGLIGLLLAVFLCAAMSSTASELNALAATSLLDVFGRFFPETTNTLWLSRLFTVFWGVLAIAFALAASLFDNLIQLVNILGSLFYGTILGVFLVAFYLPRIGAKEVLIAAILSEMLTLCLFFLPKFFPELLPNIGYLWYNVIACAIVVAVAYLLRVTNKFSQEEL